MAVDVRQDFVDRVKTIDPIFKEGDVKSFWPALRDLMDLGPERADLSKKKSHYLASLAARSIARGEPDAALAFLQFADTKIDPRHLTPFLLQERADFRRMAEETIKRKDVG